MSKIERNFVIAVSIEDVFSYLSNPMKQIEWLPSVIDVREVRGEGVGQRFNWTYKMMGMRFKGEAEYTKYIPNEWLAYNTKRGIKSTWTWTFKPQGDQTLVKAVIEYTIPVPVLGNIGERLILRQNEREADAAVANIKERLEWRDKFKVLNSEKRPTISGLKV
jgi:carbon monoxide dehydrogenase subunit G